MLRSVSAMLKPLVIDTVPKRFRRRKILTWPVDYLPFHWSYPKKINVMVNSGDSIKGIENLDRQRPAGIFGKLPELESAPEPIKRMFSVDLAEKQVINQTFEDELIDRVRRHPYDRSSLEYKIAYKTFKIRLYKQLFETPSRKHIGLKVLFNRTVLKRNKYLKMLGRQDLVRYQFVKDILKIEHEFFPLGERHKKITRKGELRRLAQEWTDKVKADKMEAYHKELMALRSSFDLEKKATDEWIANEIKELKLTEDELKELEFQGILN